MTTNARWLSAALLILAAPLAAEAQPGKVARVGFLVSQEVTGDSFEALRSGRRELGWTEGQNLTLEGPSPEGDPGRLPVLAAALVRLPVDVLVASATPASLAAKQATTTVPIVSVYTLDPVSVGPAASLARPGGNVTGLSTLSLEYAGKMLELLGRAVPNVPRVAVLGDPANAWSRRISLSMSHGRVPIAPSETTSAPRFSGAYATVIESLCTSSPTYSVTLIDSGMADLPVRAVPGAQGGSGR